LTRFSPPFFLLLIKIESAGATVRFLEASQ
jgi:hypothetical protein